MTDIKKIGLTALAGSLAATAYAQAGELSVSGTARIEYQSTQDTVTTNTDSFADNSTLVFSGSGELDNGFVVSYMQAVTPGTSGDLKITSESTAVDMGDMGVLSMGQLNVAGIGTIQDMVPNAGEQPWDDLGTHGAPEQGIAAPHTGHRLGYKYDAGMAIVSAAMNYENNSPTTSVAIQLPGLVEGLNIGGGLATDASAAGVEDDIETVYATYSMGPISVGIQNTKIEKDLANRDIERDSYGITFNVNENLSIGYGVSDTEFEQHALDEENTGYQVSYTAGGMKIGFVNNIKDNSNGADTDIEMNELMLTFSF
jgi:outer membrane protein OmpU